MGGFVSAVKRGVYWIGKMIAKFIRWLCGYITEIGKKVARFLFYHEKIIKTADDPKAVGKLAAIKKYKSELDKLGKELEKGMTKNDLDSVDEMLKEDDSEFREALNTDQFDKDIEAMFNRN